MFNTASDDFYTVLVKPYGHDYKEQTMHIFESFDEAIEYVKGRSSWDCRPHAGKMDEWYDAGSGRIYYIVSCDDCGRW